MPKSGQLYDRHVLQRSALLREFWALSEPLVPASSAWPTLEQYSAFVERERRMRAPDLSEVQFAPFAPRQRRPRRRGALDLQELYDGKIVMLGQVPCLESSYHDLFNALVWAAFPRSKRAIHLRQFRALQRWLPAGASRLPNRRTREQDALTLFDEGGAVLIATGDGVASRTAQVVPFGHAVMEHVCFQRGAVRSAAVWLELPPMPLAEDGERALLDAIDRELSRRLLNPASFCTPDFDAVVTFEPPDAWHMSLDAALSGAAAASD
jgi:hypothetical protein